MVRLVFIVEGDTEILLVEKLIVPYLIKQGFSNTVHAQTITTNRKQHKKGGVGSYGLFKNEVRNTLAQGNVLVTTLIDFFKLPTDFPNYTKEAFGVSRVEEAVHKDLKGNNNFIPYIQLHEIEALMFSSMEGFELVVDDPAAMKKIFEIMKQYPNPEDINNSSHTAPSKRLEDIFKYDKPSDGEMILEMVGMEAILDKCPRFAQWINTLMDRLREFNQ